MLKQRAKIVLTEGVINKIKNLNNDNFNKLLEMNGQIIDVNWPHLKANKLDEGIVNFNINNEPMSMDSKNFQYIGEVSDNNTKPLSQKEALLIALESAMDDGDLFFHGNLDIDEDARNKVLEFIKKLSDEK